MPALHRAVHRSVLSKIPKKHTREVAAVFQAIHAQENASEARAKAQRLSEKFQTKFPEATKVVADAQWISERSWTKKRYVLMEAFEPNESILDAAPVDSNSTE